MTGWISARRAEAFESSLSSTTPGSDADAELRELVGALRSLESPAPRPEFIADLRERLMVEAATVLQASPADRERTALEARLLLPEANPRRTRRLAAAAASVVLVGTGSTVAMAAQSALPGDSLYPIKRLVESAQTSITFSDSAKGVSQLDHARARLSEAEDLMAKASKASLAEVPSTLEAFSDQAREGADTLLADYASSEDRAAVESIRSFAADSLTRVEKLARGGSGAELDSLADAARTLLAIDASATAMCPTCSGSMPDVGQLLAAAAAPDPVAPTAEGTPSQAPLEDLPTVDPDKVEAANKPTTRPEPSPTSRPSESVTQHPVTVPSQAPTSAPTSKAPRETDQPTKTPTSPGAIKGLTDTLLGSGDGATDGVVPGVVGGVVGLVDGLLGSLLPSRKPTP